MNRSLRVLLIEDSEDDAELLLRQLRRDGYNPICERVDNALAMEKALHLQSWDIIISDYILPQFSGLKALQLLKSYDQDIPCIIWSGKITEETAVAAMKAGARDYVMKDNLSRLSPAIERELEEARARREKAKAEEALRESNKLNTGLTEYAPNPLIVVNPDKSIRHVNPAFKALTGYSLRELIGQFPPRPWWPLENQKQILSEYKNDKEKSIHLKERRYIKKNGDSFWVDITSIPIRDEKGVLSYILYSWIDVTVQKQLNDEMEYYMRKVIEAQEEERSRIARELHDDTAQSLAMITLELDALLQHRKLAEENTLERLERLKEKANQSLEEVRRFSHELRPSVLDYLGLLAAIEQLVEDNYEEGSLEVKFTVIGDERPLSGDVQLALFRIVQESLNNVRKHARAKQAVVSLDFGPGRVRMKIQDNGAGFNSQVEMKSIREGHRGLIGMKERARLIGATLKLESQSGKGTTVLVDLPD